MNKNVIVDNEDVLIVEDFLGWLVVNKNTGGWSVLFAEEGIEPWFEVIGTFSKDTSEKIIKSNILDSYDEKEREMFLKVLKKEVYITYTAEVFMNGDLVATTPDYTTYKEICEAIDRTFKKEDQNIEIYRTINEPNEDGLIKQHHTFVCEL